MVALTQLRACAVSPLTVFFGAASCVLAITSHILWFRHFTTTETFYPFSEILAFFLFCVWLVPFGFFVSLSANESSLPQVRARHVFVCGRFTCVAPVGLVGFRLHAVAGTSERV